jgi:hypothetical protein
MFRLTAIVAVVLTASFVCSSASLAVPKTTAPGQDVSVYFVISDKKVAYEIFRHAAGGATDQLFPEKYVLRGDRATFIIINRSKNPHGFTFFGHKIRVVKPGKRAHFSVTLLRRGSYAYVATTSGKKAFKGKFPVV